MTENNQKIDTAGTTGDSGPVVLDENLGIADAGALSRQLSSLAETNVSLVLDGSQIKIIDTAILQLLVALFQQSQKNGGCISWDRPTDALCKTATLLGLEAHLGLTQSPT